MYNEGTHIYLHSSEKSSTLHIFKRDRVIRERQTDRERGYWFVQKFNNEQQS